MAGNKPYLPGAPGPSDAYAGRQKSALDKDVGKLALDVRKIADGRLAGVLALDAAPTGGTWAIGDTVRNSNPGLTISAAGEQYFVWGWCYVNEGAASYTWAPVKAWQSESSGIASATLTATNVGTGKGAYLSESGGILQFRTFKSGPGTGVTISVSGNELAFDITFTPFTAASMTATNAGTGSQFYINNNAGVLSFRTLKAGVNASLSTSGSEIVVMGPSGLTTGRIPYATTGGSLVDTANIAYDASNARLNLFGAPSTSGNDIYAQKTTGGQFGGFIQNLSTANNAYGIWGVYNSATGINIIHTSTAYSTAGLVVASQTSLEATGAGGLLVRTGSGAITFATAGSATTNLVARMHANRNVQVGSDSLTVSSSVGFLHIPAVAGAPVAVPVAITGYVPICFDTTNNKIMVYNGGWKGVAVA